MHIYMYWDNGHARFHVRNRRADSMAWPTEQAAIAYVSRLKRFAGGRAIVYRSDTTQLFECIPWATAYTVAL